MAGEYTKELNGLTFSTLESSGIDSPNIGKDIKDAARKERGNFELFMGDIMPAAVKITNSKGESFVAYGYKKTGDQQPLDISHVQDTEGKSHRLNSVITVEFDTVNNPSKNEVKGAIKNDSANSLVNVIRAKLSEQWEKFDRKEREQDGGRQHKGNKGELRADQSGVKYEVASVDTNSRPLNTPAGNPALMKAGREGIA